MKPSVGDPQLPDPSFKLLDRRAGQIELVAQRPEALLLGRIEQALPGDAGLAGDIGEPARQIGDYRRRLERRPGQVRRDHLGECVQLRPGPLGIPHQVLVEHDAEVTGALTHLFQRAAAQQVDERHTFGIEQLEREPNPLGWILDPRERVGDIGKQILAPAEVAALVAERNAHLRERVLRLARALRRLGRAAGEALQRHVQRLLLDTRSLGSEAQLLQRLDADPDLVRGLADRIRRRDRAIDQGGEAPDRCSADSAPPRVRMPVRSSSAWRPRPFSPPEARSPAVSMRFRLCSPLWPTETSSALTWPPPSTARRIA